MLQSLHTRVIYMIQGSEGEEALELEEEDVINHEREKAKRLSARDFGLDEDEDDEDEDEEAGEKTLGALAKKKVSNGWGGL